MQNISTPIQKKTKEFYFFKHVSQRFINGMYPKVLLTYRDEAATSVRKVYIQRSAVAKVSKTPELVAPDSSLTPRTLGEDNETIKMLVIFFLVWKELEVLGMTCLNNFAFMRI